MLAFFLGGGGAAAPAPPPPHATALIKVVPVDLAFLMITRKFGIDEVGKGQITIRKITKLTFRELAPQFHFYFAFLFRPVNTTDFAPCMY